MGQKNFILAVVISVGFIFIWTTYVVPHFTPPSVVPVTSSVSEVSVTGSPVVSDVSLKKFTPPTVQASLNPVILKDAFNEVVIDPVGGAIRRWTLSDQNQKFDLVLNPETKPLPLTSFPDSVFSVKIRGSQAVMETLLANGVRVQKTLTLAATGHLHQLSYRLANASSVPIELEKWESGWGTGLNTVDSEKKENAGLTRVLAMARLKAHVIKEGEQTDMSRWAAIDNRYYLVAFVPKGTPSATIYSTGKKETSRLHIVENTRIPARQEKTIDYELYVGPKGYTALKKYDKQLEESVDFGFFGALGKLILRAMYRLKSFTGNYGTAIILLTVILQLLMLPLTLKSFKAAQAMKILQPKIKALQERFKGDPKRLNVEMMNLYKTSGTNPFGGCLPMLLQLPIFWALFTALRNAYELRGAPFALWIQDLSIHDPYYALPIIMGAGMFVQQRMGGAISDPMQRQMMYMMPIIFVFMFASFPAGLVLYWLTNSVVTIIAQYIYIQMHQPGTPDKPEIVKV